MKVLLLWLALTAAASDSAATGGDYLIPGIPPAAEPPAAEEVHDRAYHIGLKLRCPVCQGLSVSDSNAEAAVAMQRRIRDMVAAGYTRTQIEDYFIDRYGEWVLLDPPAEGLNLVIWLAPIAATGLGLAWAGSVVLKWRREEEDPVPLPSDQGLVKKDKFEERLLAELDE